MANTVATLLAFLKEDLQTCSPDLYTSEAEQILEAVLQCSRNDLYLFSDRPVSEVNYKKIINILSLRKSGKPLQYALGKVYFYSSEFIVDENVLIPRPDTETLIETVLKNETSSKKFFADIGTGSGIIAQTILLERDLYKAVAIDISQKALKTANKNIGQKGSLLCCDKTSSIKPIKQFDFIVSNPPYITQKEMNELESSVLDHEPHNALFGGKDGLYFYRHFSKTLSNYLKPFGNVYFEIGYLQGADITDILKNDGWINVETIKDLGGRDRVIKASLSE